MNDYVLSCQAVTSGYKDAMVIRDISLAIKKQSIFTILGNNGMGKSTLMKTIMGLVKLSDGKVIFAGDDITGLEPEQLVHRKIAYIPQEGAIFQDLTVEENLRLAVENDRLLSQRLDKVAAYFPVIPERLKQKAGTLSGGEQKMLLMSRALIVEPQLILIDEISEGLQPMMVTRMADVLQRLTRDEGVTILMAEQNVNFVSNISDSVAFLKIGSIREELSLEQGPDVETMLLEKMKI